MQSVSSNHDPSKGLPPVQPPSGKFLAQLFLVPLAIVAVAVSILVFLNWLVGGYQTPEQMLRDLGNPNPEVRWRAASDLAQILKRDPSLAANPTFALKITEKLQTALRDNEVAERVFSETQKQTLPKDAAPHQPSRELLGERRYVEFLISCLGNFWVPIGAPVLNDLAVKESGLDPEVVIQRRTLAVFALADLASNLERFDRLSASERAATLVQLENEAGDSPGGQWAAKTLDCLRARDAGRPTAMGVDLALETCAASNDLMLRKLVALALTFWQGTSQENERMEATLLKLSDAASYADADGFEVREIPEKGAEPLAPELLEGLRRRRIREVRYQATEALARRGSKKVAERMPVLREMLDPDALAAIFRATANGKDVPDTAIVGVITTSALASVAELHRKLAAGGDAIDLDAVVAAVEKLKDHENPAIRIEAERTLLALKNPVSRTEGR